MKIIGLIFIIGVNAIFATTISFFGCKDNVVDPGIFEMVAPWSIDYDDQHFWISDDSLSVIFKLTPDKRIVSFFNLPDMKIGGITSDGDYLWVLRDKTIVTDTTELYIYKVSKLNGNVSDSIIVHLPHTVEMSLFDICYFRTKLFISFNGGWGPCIFEINPNTKKLEREFCCSHPCGLSIINEELWCVRNNREDGCGNYLVKLSFSNDFIEEEFDTKISLEYFASDFVYNNNQLTIIDRDSKVLRTVPYNL